jgi:hypothetical protein
VATNGGLHFDENRLVAAVGDVEGDLHPADPCSDDHGPVVHDGVPHYSITIKHVPSRAEAT